MGNKCLSVVLVLLSLHTLLQAQNNPPVTIPQGRFLADSFEVGRPFRFALTFRHAATEDVLFPDSTAFAPFLVRGTTVLPTRTDAGISADSAVYTLVSFEIQPQLTLRVPLYVVGAGDCTTVFSSTDTIFFRSKLQTAQPDTLRLRAITDVVPLRQQLNYPVLAIALVCLAVIAGLIYALFGRFLTKQWQLWQLRQNHRRFLRRYNELVRTLNPETAAEEANQAVVRWKQYMERLERQPFTTMTTSEIVNQIATLQTAVDKQGQVENALKITDRMIYGGAFSDESKQALELLQEVAIQTYLQRRRTMQQTPVDVAAQLAESE